MPPSALRDRKRERTRRALYERAVELFEARGYEGTTVAEIAAAAEVGTRTFFNYFASKEELLFPEPDDRVSSTARAIAARGPDERPVEVLLRALRAAGDNPGKGSGDTLAARIAVIRAQVSRHIPAVSGRAAYAQLTAQQEIAEQLRTAFPEELDEVGAAALVGAVVGAVSGALTALFQTGAIDDPAELQRKIQETTSKVLAPWLTAPRANAGREVEAVPDHNASREIESPANPEPQREIESTRNREPQREIASTREPEAVRSLSIRDPEPARALVPNRESDALRVVTASRESDAVRMVGPVREHDAVRTVGPVREPDAARSPGAIRDSDGAYAYGPGREPYAARDISLTREVTAVAPWEVRSRPRSDVPTHTPAPAPRHTITDPNHPTPPETTPPTTPESPGYQGASVHHLTTDHDLRKPRNALV